MYQSLYRKYRPSTFEEVIGQKVIVKTLENAILNNKISHAYLFTGPRGTGKTSIAKILAKTVNCQNLNGIIPCNKCVSCTQINKKQSIDIYEIDAASNNGVDEIRELNSKVNLVPSVGKYKIYIIDEVHMLTVGAFNALLKTLEEPPSHIIFILATTEPHKIPATILSRCQRYDFKKLAECEIESRINQIVKMEKINITAEAINAIAKLSDGGMRDSLSILDQVIAYANNDITIEDVHEVNGSITKMELFDFINLLCSNELEKILKKIDEYDELGKDFIKLTEEIIEFFKNILLYETVPNYLKESNINVELYNKFNIDKQFIMEYIKEFNNLILEMKNSNNPKLNFELLFIKLCNPKLENKVDENTNLISNDYSNLKIVKKITNGMLSTNQKIIEEPKNNVILDSSIMIDEKVENIKKIRINNTLCSFDKKKLIELKSQIGSLSSKTIDDKCGELYSLILDGELKAFGNNILIFVYSSKRISDDFNYQLKKIDQVIKDNFDSNYKTISTYSDDWNLIKKEFNSKIKKYEYIEEPKIEIDKNTNNEIENMFDSLVEYN